MDPIKDEKTDRLAVVIGNSDYENLTNLANAIKDAKAIKETLRDLGFEVSGGINLLRIEMLKHFNEVLDAWKTKAKEIVVYFSGHGVSVDGKVYIAPVDASDEFTEDLIEESFLSVERVIKLLIKHRTDEELPIIIILDCCRFEATSDATRGQADPLEGVKEGFGSHTNIAILYSTADGQVAQDGQSEDDHSPFTQILLENIVKDCNIYEINNVITRTLAKSGKLRRKQASWMYQSLHEPYRFRFPISTAIIQEVPSKSVVPGSGVKYHFYGVPAKNYNFVDRQDILTKMEASLGKDEGNIIALRGLGGMGKTQMMLQYCYLHRSNHSSIFWLEADGKIAMLNSFHKLAVNLGLNELDEENSKEKYTEEKAIDLVCAWLQKKAKWLLLLDNVDEVMATELFNILPRIGGDIILTTREYIPSGKAKIILVDKMNENESLSLLFNDPFDSIDQQSEQFRYAKEIVAELDSMPLAIGLARSYIDDLKISYKEYFNMLRSQRNMLFSRQDRDNSHPYTHTLMTTWQLSFERIRTQSPVAGHILDVCAFLQPDAIPMNFFERQYSILKHESTLPPSSSNLEDSKTSWITIRTAIAMLIKLSFLIRTSNENADKKDDQMGDTLTIHRLIQNVIYGAIDDEQKIRLAYNLAMALNNETKFSDPYLPVSRTIMDIYLPHIRHFVTLLNDVSQTSLLSTDLQELLERTVNYLLNNGIFFGMEPLAKLTVSLSESLYGIDNLQIVKPLLCLAQFYRRRNLFMDAEPLFQRALSIREKELGPNHIDTAVCLNELALLYDEQGKYTDAESLHQRALTISENVLGPDHPYTASSLDSLAFQYSNQGKYTEAEPLFRRALAIKEKTLGSDDPRTATSLNKLASLYETQGKYSDAEPLYQQALAIRERRLGSEHIYTAISLSSLASIYNRQGKYLDAELLFQRALAIYEKVLGPEHSDTATLLVKLASLHQNQGKYTDAELLYRQALVVIEKNLGSEHPYTATSLEYLASLYQSQGKFSDAEPLHQRALMIREKVLGPEHPNTVDSLNYLGMLYQSQNNYISAEQMYQKALKIQEKLFEPENIDIAYSLNNLASIYNSLGKYTAAEPLYQRALDIYEKVLGPEHTEVANCLTKIAIFYQGQGKYTDAEPLYRQALTIWEKASGPEHPDTAYSLDRLASLLRNQGKYSDAELLYKRALSIYEKVLGPENLDLASTMEHLALLYEDQSRYSDAGSLYQRALAIVEKFFGPEHPKTTTFINNLALFYDNQGNYVNAELLYQRSLKIFEKALGPEHLDVAVSLNNLAVLYKSQGNYTNAEPLYKRALEIYEKVLGPDHPKTAVYLDKVALFYLDQGKYADAAPLDERARRIREKTFESEQLEMTTSPNNLETLQDTQSIDNSSKRWNFVGFLKKFKK